MTSTKASRQPTTVASRLLRFARRALVIEVRMYDSVLRFVLRRPAVPTGATGFRYDAPTRPRAHSSWCS